MDTAKPSERLFIDKRALTVLCAVILVFSVPLAMVASYGLWFGCALVLPSFAVVGLGTLLQELLHGKTHKSVQIFISSVKYAVASGWAIYSVFIVAGRLAERVEKFGYPVYLRGYYIAIVGFALLVALFMLALVLEIRAVVRGEKMAKSHFLFIDKPKIMAMYISVMIFSSGCIATGFNSPMLVFFACVAGVTLVQEIIFRFCPNLIVQRIISAIKWFLTICYLMYLSFLFLVFVTFIGLALIVAIILGIFTALLEMNVI